MRSPSRDILLTNRDSGLITAFKILKVGFCSILLHISQPDNIAGAKFHSSLTQPKRSQVIKKGTNPLIDAYSAFFDNTDIKGSGDTGLRRLVEDSTEIVVVGLAQDYCVAWTCLDSLGLRLPTTILTDHTRPVDPDTGDQMMERVRDAGGIVTTLRDYQVSY